MPDPKMTKEFEARYVDEVIEDGFELRVGPAGTHLLDLAANGGFDMVIAVWSQLAPGTKAEMVFRLLAQSPIPVLLVPSTGVATQAHDGDRTGAVPVPRRASA